MKQQLEGYAFSVLGGIAALAGSLIWPRQKVTVSTVTSAD